MSELNEKKYEEENEDYHQSMQEFDFDFSMNNQDVMKA